MDPASRNRVLMIGGGLIVIALLLVCGPLEGRFGGGEKAVQELPPVAAAPPEPVVDEQALIEAAEASAIGVATGAAIGESDLGTLASGTDVVAPSVDPPIVVKTPLKVVEAAPRKQARRKLPAVSAGPPVPAPVVPVLPTTQELAANAADAFDRSLAGTPQAFDGNVVDRFAPPVDSGPRVSIVAGAAQGFNSLALRPCDTPGAGCQNVAPATPSVFLPVIPGTVPVNPGSLPGNPGLE